MSYDIYHQNKLVSNALTLSDAASRAMAAVTALLPATVRGSEVPFMVFRPWPLRWDSGEFKPPRQESPMDAFRGYVVFDGRLLDYNVRVFEYRP